MKHFFLLLSLLFLGILSANAQINLSLTTTPSTCSANGSITCNASGSSSPYVFDLLSASGTSQTNPLFTNLTGGTYTVQVTSATGASTTQTAVVANQYTLPSVPTVVVNAPTVTVTAHNGKPPYRYAYMANGDTTIWTNGHIQNSNIFSCMPDGNWTFITYDACGNFYPLHNVFVNTLPLTANCIYNSNNTTSILFNVTGANAAPYQFHCVSNTGAVTNNTTGQFNNLAGCEFEISYTDRCGRNYPPQTYGCRPQTLYANLLCFNQNTNTITLQAGGGVPPYNFSYTNPYTGVTTTNTTGVFTNVLPEIFNVSVTDNSSCPQNIEVGGDITVENFAAYPCPFNNTIQYNWISNYSYYNGQENFSYEQSFTSATLLLGNNVIATNLYPATSFSIPSKNPDYKIVFRDACGILDTVEVTDGGGFPVDICYNSVTGTATLIANGIPPYTYGYINPFTQDTTYNDTGIFNDLPLNFYSPYFVVEDQCIRQIIRAERFNIRIICDSVRILLDSSFTGTYTFYLYDNNNTVVQTNNTGIFTGFEENTLYSIRLFVEGCEYRSYPFSKPPPPLISYGLERYGDFVNGHCERLYRMEMDTVDIDETFQITRAIDNTVLPLNFIFTNLQPGTYYVESTFRCAYDTIVLPPIQSNLSLTQVTTGCSPNGASIKVTGGLMMANYSDNIDNEPTLNGHAFNNTNYNDNYYTYYSINGNLSVAGGGNGTVGNFYNLPQGNTYNIYVYTNGANTQSGYCPVDTITAFVPFYVRPTLISSYGVICAGSNTGNLMATVLNGTPPFIFTLDPASIPVGYTGPTTITTTTNTATFTNLPSGSYSLHVRDNCLISADYAASVGAYNFTPQYQRFCNGEILLSLPVLTNASYTWTNASGATIGTSNSIFTNDTGAATYSVNVSVNSCAYNQIINVPAQTLPDVVANAGADINTISATITQNGNAPATGQTGTWIQIAGPTALIQNPNNPTTTTTLPSPNIYTFVWKIDGGINGCIDTDTMQIIYCATATTPNAVLAIGNSPTCIQPNTSLSVIFANGTGSLHSYMWSNGSTQSAITNATIGTYSVTVTANNVCSGSVVLSHTFNDPGLYTTTQQSIYTCNNQPFTYNGHTYTQSGVYKDTIFIANACDTIVSTTLIIQPNLSSTQIINHCDNNPYIFNGNTYTTTGVYTNTLTSFRGCDSIVTTHLTFFPTATQTQTITTCGNIPYTIGGNSYTQSGTYTNVLQTINGCDSTVITHLTVLPVFSNIQNILNCNNEPFIFNGNTYTLSGNYIDTLQAINGCDSIIHTNLVIYPTISNTQNITTCNNEPFSYNGHIYTQTGSYLDTLTAQNGCDSIIITNLLIIPTINTVSQTISICNGTSYTIGGSNYTQSGTYTNVLQTINGCDSTVITHLTVLPVFSNTQNIIHCNNEPFIFNGNVYTLSGNYIDTLQMLNGCDSIIHTNLVIYPTISNTQNITTCNNEPFSYNGHIYTQTGSYLDTLTAQNGCDSIIITNLLITPTINTVSQTISICNGTSYTIGGNTYTQSGTYTNVLQTINGCDSTVITNLTVLPVFSNTQNILNCNNEPFIFNGNIYTLSGNYIDTLQTLNGCDSIIHTNLVIYPTISNTQNITTCNNEPFSYNGHIYTQTGSYLDTLTAQNGCDSIMTTNLLIQPFNISQQTIERCIDSPFIYNGNTYTQSGTYQDTITNPAGCNTIMTTYLTIHDLPIATAGRDTNSVAGQPIQLNASGGDTYLWEPAALLNDATIYNPIAILTESITFTVTVTDANGCRATDNISITFGGGGLDCLGTTEGFSPNGDGYNDTWVIPCLEGTNNQLDIYNRWGQLLFSVKNYANNWNGEYNGKFDGEYQGKPLPDATYYFIIHLFDANGNKLALHRGNITILR